MQLEIVWVGSQPLVQLEKMSANIVLHVVDTLPEAEQYLAGQHHVVLLVISQDYPEQITQSEIASFHRLSPTTRIIQIAGQWCEGDMRTGRRLDGVWRIYWHQAETRLTREILELVQNRPPIWRLPLTATADEQALRGTDGQETASLRGLRIAVDAVAAETTAGLSTALVASGACLIGPPTTAEVDDIEAIVWDDERRSLDAELTVRRLSRDFPSSPIVALLGFPREPTTLWTEGRPVRVLAKPFDLRDLTWELRIATGKSPIASACERAG